MKKLLLAIAVACIPCFALTCPSGFVEITGPALAPDGSNFSGIMTLSLGYNTTVGGSSVRRSTVVTTVTAGVLDVCLAPGNYTDTNRVTGSTLSYSTTWTIPAGGPYTVQAVEGTGPITPTTQVAPSQITGGTDTQVIAKVAGVAQWADAGVASFNGRAGAVTPGSSDYTTAQVAESGNLYLTTARVIAAMSGLYEVPLTFSGALNRSTNTITCLAATSLQFGCLPAVDWTTFNGKQNALGFTPLNPANNLSDLAVVATARTNLGLSTVAATGSYADLSSKPTNIATATALAANGTNCSSGSYALGVDASGNSEGCTAAPTGIPYPGAGIPVSTGSAWGASKATPSGAVVGDTDSQNLTNKTLTAPKVGQINDTNGNAAIVVAATTSAVNQVTVTNAATGANPSIAPTGTDATIGLDIKPKGANGRVRLLSSAGNPLLVTNDNQGDAQLYVATTNLCSTLTGSTLVAMGCTGIIGTSIAGFSLGGMVSAGSAWRGYGLELGSAAPIGFSSTTSADSGTYDAGVGRNAAGVVEINSGSACSTAGNCRDLKLRHTLASGTAPTITSGFGTTPSIAGADGAGRLTVGTGGSATTGVITFGTAWGTAPACVANDESTIKLVQATATTTTLTLTAAAAFTASDLLTWHCTGY